MEVLAQEQYRSRALKSADIKDLNTRLFYNLVLLKRTTETIIFIGPVSNYELFLHIIDYLAL